LKWWSLIEKGHDVEVSPAAFIANEFKTDKLPREEMFDRLFVIMKEK